VIEAAGHFALGGSIGIPMPYGSGLINDTYLVEVACTPPRRVIIQRLNPGVFSDPVSIMENMRAVIDSLKQHDCRLNLPEIFRTRDDKDFWIDENENCWRALSHIDHTRTLDSLTSAEQARQIGLALGEFHLHVQHLGKNHLKSSLRGFHNTPRYLQRFDEALARNAPAIDSQDMLYCLRVIAAGRERVDIIEDEVASGRIPVRTVHGDPKLDNFLFDEDGARVVSLIDLDTVQAAPLAYDIGDCLRSCCNKAGESPRSGFEAAFDMEIAAAILDGYFSTAKAILCKAEVDSFGDAIGLIPYELGLRFLSDHILGNRYFKTSWPGQNLLRAVTQFRLAESVADHADAIRIRLAEYSRNYALDDGCGG